MNKDKYYLWVGKELKKYRKKNKLTLTEVASRIGVTFKQVQNYENGVSRIAFPTIIELCQLYGINVKEFTMYSLEELTKEDSNENR